MNVAENPKQDFTLALLYPAPRLRGFLWGFSNQHAEKLMLGY